MKSPQSRCPRRVAWCLWSSGAVAIVWVFLMLGALDMISHHKVSTPKIASSVNKEGPPTTKVPKKRWAVAALLTTRPSSKSDGWKPRSVAAANGTSCPAGRSLCAVLVLGESLKRYGDIEADFVVMVDSDASPSLLRSLAAHGAVPISMDFDGFPVFEQYVLFRKMYILALVQYERVLLLDIDGVVTGSLRFLFESPMTCGEPIVHESPIAASTANRKPQQTLTSPCLPVDAASTCQQSQAEILAQQTSGTPVLTAYFMVRPNMTTWQDVGKELAVRCGRVNMVCDRSTVHSSGWGEFSAPHDWATRAAAPNRGFKQGQALSWADMGAGFADQGFVEYFFALKRRTALLVSKWSCAKRLHYLHFNVPPKPWNCPDQSACAPATDDTRHRSKEKHSKYDSPITSRAWGGHHCARDWWWQYTLARPALGAAAAKGEHSCLSTCLNQLDSAFIKRGEQNPIALYRDYIPGSRCAHLWPHFGHQRRLTEQVHSFPN